MTERCQTKFTEKFDNQNYIIYVAIIIGSIAVLYFYRFHFATIAFSYGLGCVACYYVLESRILHKYVEQLKCHFVRKASQTEPEDNPIKGCVTCGSSDCSRHDPTAATEPWTGLHIHKQLDQAIEDFYNAILDQFINSWYSKITLQPFFVDELRHQLRYASACLLRRAVKINYSRFITERLLPCALRHYTLCADLSDGANVLDSKLAVHPAAANRNAELKYLRCITNAIMPYLLKNADLQTSVFRVLIKEIFAGWVLLSLTDVLADPYILNTLIILATGDVTMAPLPSTPNYKVEFLETFVRHTDSVYIQRSKLLKIDLDLVMTDPDYFYAFMQYMKTTSHLHLLQFYRDIKSFQTRILNPEFTTEEQDTLYREAADMYSRYLCEDSWSKVPLQPGLADEFLALITAGPEHVKRLQTSRALYQAARQSHTILEKIMLPKFLHSDEFYKLMIGSRIPTGYQKQMVKKPHEKLLHTALKLGHKLKSTLKHNAIDGQVLDCFTNLDSPEGEGVENMDILKYLDSIAGEDLREQDLSNYKVVLTNVESRLQVPPRRGPVRVFTITVHRLEADSGARLWSVERSEHDFHLLRAKLHEFHGDRLLHDLPLPSRRDNSPMETLRYKYEDFLQRLLQKSLLQTSELLHLFLTVERDFSIVVQEATLNANSTDLTNIYQSVTHRLRKEKGQHLENFMRNFLISSDWDRYQALKQGTARDIEEAIEVNEDIEVEQLHVRSRNARDIHTTVFRNNFGIEPVVCELRDRTQVNTIAGFTQCLMFLLIKVIRARAMVTGVIGSLLGVIRELINNVFNTFLHTTLCNLLSERRLAHLIRLGHGLLFGKKAPTIRNDPIEQRELARKQLLGAIPSTVALIAGSGLADALQRAFEIIQKPQLNKQLVYNLLDLCLMELFPELSVVENKTTKKPKS